MKLDKEIQKALNKQINSELHASYHYLDMACYFDAQELPGIAAWLKAHAQEEVEHAMKIYEHLVQRNAKVKLEGINKPNGEYSSAQTAFAQALALEHEVTKQIHAIFDLCHERKEYGTQNMLNWFLDEQVSEEDLFRRVLEQIKAANDDRWNMMELDRQLASSLTQA